MEKQPDTELLLKAIQDRAEQERQEILAQGRDHVAKTNARIEKAIEKINADARRQAEQGIVRERDRLLGKAQADRRLALLDCKRRLLHDAFAQAEKQILAVPGSDGYREILGALISEAVEVTGPDSRLEVAAAELTMFQTLVKKKGLACTVKATQERAGTLRVRAADRRRRVDNSLYTRLARAQVHNQPEIARILFQGSVDSAGESA